MMKHPESFDESVNFVGLIAPFWSMPNNLTWVNSAWLTIGGDWWTVPIREWLGAYYAYARKNTHPLHTLLHHYAPYLLGSGIYDHIVSRVADSTQEFNNPESVMVLSGHYPA